MRCRKVMVIIPLSFFKCWYYLRNIHELFSSRPYQDNRFPKPNSRFRAQSYRWSRDRSFVFGWRNSRFGHHNNSSVPRSTPRNRRFRHSSPIRMFKEKGTRTRRQKCTRNPTCVSLILANFIAGDAISTRNRTRSFSGNFHFVGIWWCW